MNRNTLLVLLHLAGTAIVAVALVVIGANAADQFQLPLINSWALGHGFIVVVFPVYLLLSYILLLPVVRRFRIKDATVDSSQKRLSKLAICALVFSGIGFLIPVLGNLVAVVLGHIARHRCKKRAEPDGNRLAIAALVFGYAGLVFWIFVIVTVSMATGKFL